MTGTVRSDGKAAAFLIFCYGFADADAFGSAVRECVGGSLCKVDIRVCFQCGNPFDFTGFQSGILTQSL